MRGLHEPAALGPQRILCELERCFIQRGIAEAAVGLAVGSHQERRPWLGHVVDRCHQHDALAVAHTLRERTGVARRLVALHPDLDLAAAGQADVPGFLVGDAVGQ